MEGLPGPWRTGILSFALQSSVRVWISEFIGLPAKERTCPESIQPSADKVSQSQEPGVRGQSDLIVDFKFLLDPRRNGWAELQPNNTETEDPKLVERAQESRVNCLRATLGLQWFQTWQPWRRGAQCRLEEPGRLCGGWEGEWAQGWLRRTKGCRWGEEGESVSEWAILQTEATDWHPKDWILLWACFVWPMSNKVSVFLKIGTWCLYMENVLFPSLQSSPFPTFIPNLSKHIYGTSLES